MRKAVWVILAGSIVATSVAAQDYPPAFPRINATALLETDRFVVWDIVWPKGQPTALHRHVYDQVGTYYQAGGRVITDLDGTKREASTRIGALSNTRRGTTHVEEGTTDPALRAVFIELRATPQPGQPDTPRTVAPMFPRPGASVRLDDQRVTVWDYTWPSGEAVSGARIREEIWVWLGDGNIEITSGDVRDRFPVKAGQIRHVRPDYLYEQVTAMTDGVRVMIFALR